MTGVEVREARGRLGISILRLAVLTGIPAHALQVFETTGRMCSPQYGGDDRLAALRATLEKLGVMFPDETAKTRPRKPSE